MSFDPTTAIPTMHIDGAARGNPGPAAYAVVLARPGLPVVEEAAPIGTATNNVAEYTALVEGLALAAELGVPEVAIFSDSELLVKQMNGEYRVKNADLQQLYAEACHLKKQFTRVTLTHVRREQNKRADQIGNEALDGRPRRRGEPVPAPVVVGVTAPAKAPAPKTTVTDAAVRDDALLCLAAAAQSWATHGPGTPAPALVWDQLWSLLEEANLLRKRK
ncbi:MAG: ribonuclease HI family protein [Gemmataceae bacterium]